MDSETDLIPAWFAERMTGDVWSFGLLMCDGTVIGIQVIERIRQGADGTVWLDVRLLDRSEGSDEWLKKFNRTLFAPTSRLQASVNASHIMAAFELADT